MTTISKLVVQMDAENAKLHRKLEQSQKKLKKFERSANEITGALKSFAKSSSLIGAAAAGSVAAIVLSTSRSIEELNVFSKSFGVSVVEMQKWEVAAESVGLTGEKVGDMFKDISDKLGDFIQTGGGGAADIFKRLNLDASEYIGLAPDKALIKLNDAMKDLNKQDKIFLLESLAGDLSLLLPLLDNNAEGFKKIANDAEEAGRILSEDAVAGVERFRLSIRNSGIIFSSIAKNLTSSMAPALEKLVSKTNQWIEKLGGGKVAGELLARGIIKSIAFIIRGVGKLFRALDRLTLKIVDAQAFWLSFNQPLELRIDGSDAQKKMDELVKKRTELNLSLGKNNKFIQDVDKFADEIMETVSTSIDNTADKVKSRSEENGRNIAAPFTVAEGSIQQSLVAMSGGIEKFSEEFKKAFKEASQYAKDLNKEFEDRSSGLQIDDVGESTSFIDASLLAFQAEQSVVKGDFEGAVDKAREAFAVLDRIKEAGGATSLELEGVAMKLRAVGEKAGKDKIANVAAQIEIDLKESQREAQRAQESMQAYIDQNPIIQKIVLEKGDTLSNTVSDDLKAGYSQQAINAVKESKTALPDIQPITLELPGGGVLENFYGDSASIDQARRDLQREALKMGTR